MERDVLPCLLENGENRTKTLAKKIEGKIQKLSSADEKLNGLWTKVKRILADIEEDSDQKNDPALYPKKQPNTLETISEIVIIADQTISSRTDIPKDLLEIAIILHCVIFPRIDDNEVEDKISKFFEKWWTMNLPLKQKLVGNVLKYLIETSRTSTPHLKRLYEMRSSLFLLNSNEDIRELLQLVRNTQLLNTEEGRALFAYLFRFGKRWIMGIHDNVKVSLTKASKKQVRLYAEMYAQAWLETSSEDKEMIAKKCLQDYVFHLLRAQRRGDGLELLGQNLLAFLEYFHDHSDPLIRKLIKDQYTPLIWQHLKAPGTIVRCNAAELLFSAYPIHTSTTARRRSNSQCNKEHKAMIDLLNEPDAHLCRIAIEGVSRVVAAHWSVVPQDVVDTWLSILLQLTKTSPYADLRACVFHGLKFMLSDPRSICLLRDGLSEFGGSIFDSNARVKTALIELLVHIRDSVELLYSDIVSISHLLAALEEETDGVVAELLIKLLWPRIVDSDGNLEKTIEVIRDFASINPRATRRLFLHSKRILSSSAAVDLVKLIFSTVDKRVKKSQSIKSRRKSERRKVRLENNKKEAESSNHSEPGDHSSSNAVAVQTLLDIAAILWTINSGKFAKKDPKQEITKLTAMAADLLPNFYNHFEGTPINESILFLFSLIPESVVSERETFLKNVIAKLHDINVSDDTILTVVYLLVKWKRVDELLKSLGHLVVLPDNEDSRSNLPKRRRLLRTSPNEPKIELGLKIFKCLMDVGFETVIVKDYHESLVEFWNNLSFVRGAIATRLSNCDQSNQVSDTILESLFARYVSLVPILNKTGTFDSSYHLDRVISWAESTILSHIREMDSAEMNGFPVNLMHVVLEAGNEIISNFGATPALCCTVVLLYSKCLATPSGILFVRKALTNMTVLMDFNQSAFKNDESHLLCVVVPSLLTAVMITLTKYPGDVARKYTDKLKDLPALLHKIFAIVDRTVKRGVVSFTYMTIIVDTIIICIYQNVTDSVNASDDSSELLNKSLPWVSEKLLKVVTRRDKLQDLCIDVIENSMITREPKASLCVLLVVHKMLRMSKLPVNRLRCIASAAKTTSTDRSHETPFDSSVDAHRKLVIEAILELA